MHSVGYPRRQNNAFKVSRKYIWLVMLDFRSVIHQNYIYGFVAVTPLSLPARLVSNPLVWSEVPLGGGTSHLYHGGCRRHGGCLFRGGIGVGNRKIRRIPHPLGRFSTRGFPPPHPPRPAVVDISPGTRQTGGLGPAFMFSQPPCNRPLATGNVSGWGGG